MNFSDQWKVLIYDNSGRDIISPLMSVGFLRQKGVTLHLNVSHISNLINGLKLINFFFSYFSYMPIVMPFQMLLQSILLNLQNKI